MVKCLVLGGAGFIGSHLSNFLSEKGYEVTVLDDLSLGIEENLNKEIKFHLGSVLDSDLVDKLVKENFWIFHQAAKSSSPMFKDDPRYGLNVNINGFMNVIQSAKKHNKKVIYASSSSVYNGLPMPFREDMVIDPKTFYEAGFYARELIAKSYFLEYGVESIGLRYFSVYGKNEKHKGQYANNISQFLWDMKKGNPPVIYGDGKQTRDFTHVSDVVTANILAASSDIKFGIYNVGTGNSYSFNIIIEILNTLLKSNIEPKYIPNPIKNYVYETLADNTKIKKDLHWKPEMTIDKGIESLL